MSYKYFRVSCPGCVTTTFAIGNNAVFVYNRELGGAFKHPNTPDEIYKHFKSDPNFTVEKTNSALFDNVKNWWSVREMIDYLQGVIS